MAKDNKKSKAGAATAEALRAEWEADAEAFRALGDPTRLAVLAFLRRRLADGGQSPAAMMPPFSQDNEDGEEQDGAEALTGSATVGEVSCHLYGTEKVPSNLSHHLKELRRAGLITMKRRGKHILCRLDRDAVAGLFSRQTGVPAPPPPPTADASAALALSALFPVTADLPKPEATTEEEDREYQGAENAGALVTASGVRK